MTEQLHTQKPHEYIDLGGMEQQIPAVQQIEEALTSGETFVVVGGGGSGKTESLITAFENSDKSYDMFDLRGWTVSRLSDASVRAESLSDPNLDANARTYLTQLNESIALTTDPSPSTEPKSVEDEIWDQYRYDTTLGIKYAEGYLLDKELSRLQGNSTENVVQSMDGENSLQSILVAHKDVLVLDEFDLGIGEDLAPVEIENVRKLIEIALVGTDAQLGLVVHPPARNNAEFTQAVHTALAERGDIREIHMSFYPQQVEQAALGTIGIEGELADRFMQDVQGLPTAYLDIATRPDLRAAMMDETTDVRARLLGQHVEDKIARNKRVIFDRLTPPAQEYLQGLIKGEEQQGIDDRVVQEALINLYVTESAGKIQMAPVVQRVLARELGLEQSEKRP